MSMLDEALRESLSDDRDRSFMGKVKEIIPWKGDDIREILRKFVFITAVCFLIYWAYTAYIYNFGSKTMIDDQLHLAELYNSGGSTNTDTNNPPDTQNTATTPDDSSDTNEDDRNGDVNAVIPAPPILSNFDAILKINSDAVGWLYIDGIYLNDTDNLAINNPVVQNGDNDFYLDHDIYKKESEYGTLYADFRANVAGVAGEKRSSNVTIYGHNMKTEYFFHHLRDYNRTSPTFISNHRIVNFSTLYEMDEYIIFACFLVSVNEEDDNQPIFRYHNCVEFNTDAEFDYWYKNVLYRNYYTSDIECTIDDEYLTLSTCSFEISDSRFVVVARKLRDGEDPSVYTYASNSKKHMPAKYYKAKGAKVPQDDGPDYEYYIPE